VERIGWGLCERGGNYCRCRERGSYSRDVVVEVEASFWVLWEC
jgi:hypothetical protein